MDLPTCPSCGQSVLDDDASDCPFCGAAMDGSRPAKKQPQAKAAKKKTAKKPDDDDPFAIEQAPTAKKVIPCARKPMKGRMHRVICPMCDTQGFIPKGAVGRQVKCANKECLVPVFTADGGGKAETAKRAPTRVSDESVAAETKIKEPGSKKNPILIYGIVGVVALAGTIGLVVYLNGQGETELGALDIPTMPDPDVDPDPETQETPVVENVPEYRERALELVQLMVKDSRVSGGNRDKAFCRRLTGDAYRRLGMEKESAAEFAQMEKISSDAGRSTKYYQVGPLILDYWTHLAAGENADATGSLEAAKTLASSIPGSGDTALASVIELASALTHAGDAGTAADLVSARRGDPTVESQMDTIKLAAWASLANSLQEIDRRPPAPLSIYAWHDGLRTAVAADLAVRGHWKPASDWAAASNDLRVASDCFAVIAEEMGNQQQLDSATELVVAAKSKGPDVAARTLSVLGRSSAAHWEEAKSAITSLPEITPVGMSGFLDYIKAQTPNLDPSMLRAAAITDFVIAAIRQNEKETAVDGLNRLYVAAAAAVPPSAEIRKLSAELEQTEDELKQRLTAELRLKPAEARTNFINYRRGVDKILKAAETRRRTIMLMAARIVDGGGLETMKDALNDNAIKLREELGVDRMRAILFVAAAANRQDFREVTEMDQSLFIRAFRIDPASELAIINPMLTAWDGYLRNDFSGVTALETTPRLQGLCAASARFIADGIARENPDAAQMVDSILKLKNGVWREQCLNSVMRTFARNGQIGKAVGALNKTVKSPSQRVAAFHGVLCGALDLDAEESSAK